MKKMVTSSEAARILGCSKRTFTRWAIRGKIYGYPVPVRRTKGGHARVELSELREWAERMRIPYGVN